LQRLSGPTAYAFFSRIGRIRIGDSILWPFEEIYTEHRQIAAIAYGSLIAIAALIAYVVIPRSVASVLRDTIIDYTKASGCIAAYAVIIRTAESRV
jgi:hypothetical protein